MNGAPGRNQTLVVPVETALPRFIGGGIGEACELRSRPNGVKAHARHQTYMLQIGDL